MKSRLVAELPLVQVDGQGACRLLRMDSLSDESGIQEKTTVDREGKISS